MPAPRFVRFLVARRVEVDLADPAGLFHGISIRQETTTRPGYVVYEDAQQVVAVSVADTYRSASNGALRPSRVRAKRRRP